MTRGNKETFIAAGFIEVRPGVFEKPGSNIPAFNNRQTPASKPKCAIQYAALAKEEGKGKDARRIIVRITDYRCRLLDPDDICPKYHIDACRYAQLLYGDSEKEINYERPRQIQVETKEEEKTEITLSFED